MSGDVLQYGMPITVGGSIQKVSSFTSKGGGGVNVTLQIPHDAEHSGGKLLEQLEKAARITFEFSAQPVARVEPDTATGEMFEDKEE